MAFVRLGGVDSQEVLGMSGGFASTFNLSHDSTVTVEIEFRLIQSSGHESDEISEALCSVNRNLIGTNSSIDYLARIVGNGNGGNVQTTGFRSVVLNAGSLAKGRHEVAVGGYNNKKTAVPEYTEVEFYRVKVFALASSNRQLEFVDDAVSIDEAGGSSGRARAFRTPSFTSLTMIWFLKCCLLSTGLIFYFRRLNKSSRKF